MKTLTIVTFLTICVVVLLTHSKPGWAEDSVENGLHIENMLEEIKADDDDDDDDDYLVELRKKRFPIGDPRGANATIDYGQPCIKVNAQACKLYPDVHCVHVVEQKFICRCDFLHTWDPKQQKCILNVFAPCNIAATGKILQCGPNMECRLDSIGNSDEDRFCRCLKGFKIVQNDDQIPAFCEPDENYVVEVEETFMKSNSVLTQSYLTSPIIIVLTIIRLSAEFS